MLLPQVIGGLLQEKPKVPGFDAIDTTKVQQEAIAGNLTNFGSLSNLTQKSNKLYADEFIKSAERLFPGLIKGRADAFSKGLENILEGLTGKLPSDVEDYLSRKRAEAGVASGTSAGGTSEFEKFARLRDLGLTSYEVSQRSLDSASKWIQLATQSLSTTPQFDFTKMFWTPQQKAEVEIGERDKEFQHDWVKNQLDAEYSIGTTVGRAMIKTDDQIMQIASSLAGSVGGSLMGCWIAREVYGPSNPKWVIFRLWLEQAPRWFRNLYFRFGQQIARWISNKPVLKRIIRLWMDSKIYGTF